MGKCTRIQWKKINLFAAELFQDFNPLHAKTSQLFPLFSVELPLDHLHVFGVLKIWSSAHLFKMSKFRQQSLAPFVVSQEMGPLQ